ncbi:MAG: ABC transporter permease [candidate division NC10 bacterium]|nr:ABC transporter permease [candidate division NC10 bacterium]MBI4390945.1 ABC transporter permease [candidate division NC10 bacterium]
MGAYAVKRFLTILPVLVGISLLVFSFVHLIPGDPAVAMLGERATPERVAAVRAQLGLDEPLYHQYWIYLRKVLQGDLGISVIRGDPVLADLMHRFPATVELALSAILLAIVVGIPVGVVSAVWRDSVFDGLSRLVALTGVSMPIFWLGLMLAWFFGVELGWLPTGFRLDTDVTVRPVTNLYLLDSLLAGDARAFLSSLRHLVLPAVALGTIPLAIIARMTRASLLEVLSQEYIRTAEAKGAPQRTVVLHHAMRNALLPILTVTGLQVGHLLAGAILTETIFSWPGIGLWVYEAIQARDYPIVQGATLFIGTVFVLVNLCTDLLYAAVDPRVAYD